ncbi:MAG: PAS domain S-box protein, partial [Magnetococcales bacterium]|nr:PAS domain S-box protein [Magnetococcales bacterium]
LIDRTPVTGSGAATTPPIEIEFSGTRCQVTADRRQILDLLLSTYENALAQNAQLHRKELELNRLNEQLSSHVEQLAISEERFRGLVQTIPDIVYRLDAEGRFTFLNNAIRHLGYDPAELLGQHFSDIIDSAQV